MDLFLHTNDKQHTELASDPAASYAAWRCMNPPSSSPLPADLFAEPANWLVAASGQAEGRLSAIGGPAGQAGLRLEYDFHGGSGFVVIRKELGIALPETFAIGFKLRGEGPPNHFEFKVADRGGANVWRHLQPDCPWPPEWTPRQVRERDLPFAWGPAGGGAAAEVGAIEFAVVAGPGGCGTLELTDFSLRDESFRTAAQVAASSSAPGHAAAAVFSGGGWQAEKNDPHPWWSVDFGRPQRFGGMSIDWPECLPPRAYVMEVSADGSNWTAVHQASRASGARSHIAVAGGEARHLRLSFAHAGCAAITGIKIQPDGFSRSPNEFMHAVAADAPRGWHPRYWHREQSYWTPVGTPEGGRRALLNEEGLLEVDEAGFSLEPFLLIDGRLVTWDDVTTTPALPADGAPLPSVTWQLPGMRLHVRPWVDGRGTNLTLRASYRVEWDESSPPASRLVVALRPLQVNPPWQAFRNLGGISPIHHISGDAAGLRVDGRQVIPNIPADAVGAAAFEEGGVLPYLANGLLPASAAVEDASGLASAALVWDIGPARNEVIIAVPFFAQAAELVENARDAALSEWNTLLDRVQWRVPASAAPAIACFRTAAAHILINRDGAAIQPGPRRYTRSWIRDCVIMGAALAKANIPHALSEFLQWYVPFQRADGFVPCVVDRDGIDWLVEHDSHGQLLWGVREVFRAEDDRAFLESMRQPVIRAAEYLLHLRGLRMTAEYTTPEHAACYGLLPESASHEGYLAHPVHSYWDDFWGVRGLHAAAELARAMDLPEAAERWQRAATAFLTDVRRSLEHVIANHKLAYIPGSVEWADFDPTATANAIALLDFADDLPAVELHAMLETYLAGFRRKHRGQMPWMNYTAYEIRLIGAFVRLGQRAAANELLEFFLTDRRPIGWNQWPEITWQNPRAPGHLGDVPHTWIAAEYLLALASMVASERDGSDSLVLAGGLSWEWIVQDDGFAVAGLPTRHGLLDFKISATSNSHIAIEVAGLATLPTGGLWLAPPLPLGQKILCATTANGEALQLNAAATTAIVTSLPLSADLRLGPDES